MALHGGETQNLRAWFPQDSVVIVIIGQFFRSAVRILNFRSRLPVFLDAGRQAVLCNGI